MRRKLLALCAIGCAAVACNGVTIVSPRPALCEPEWSLGSAAEFYFISEDSELARLIVGWNESCAKNYALVGLEWRPPQVVKPKTWWRFWE